MSRYALWALALGGTLVEVTAAADDLARCSSIAADAARLACYDTLARRTVGSEHDEAMMTAPSPPSASTPSASRPSASTPSVPPSTSPPASPGTVVNPADPKNFGLTPAQQHLSSDNGPKSIQAQIISVSRDTGHAYVRLDSGQTWTVEDDDGRLSIGDLVTIKRAALASYLLLSPANHTYRVRRLR